MARYFTQPRSSAPRANWIDEDYPMILDLTVSDHEAVETGLIDANGWAIFRAPNPIGFGRDEEW